MRKSVSFLILFSVSIFLSGCYETDNGTFTLPITIYEKMEGTWRLTKLIQVDEIAVASALEPSELTLTNKFDFKSFNITFNVDEEFQPTSFEVTGNAPHLFLQNGFWALSHPFPNTDGNPVRILLYSDESKTSPIDELDIIAVPGKRKTMEFFLTREANNLPYVTYQYSIKLQE